MAWREYLSLFKKYEGDIGLATEREIEHAGRGMDPVLARQIAEADYKRKERIKENESNAQKAAHGTEPAAGNNRFTDSLF